MTQIEHKDQRDRVRFFDRVKKYVSNDMYLTVIEMAYDEAKKSHQGQLRDDGSRYFDHAKRAALIFLDAVDMVTNVKGQDVDEKDIAIVVIATLLHDVVEDTYNIEPRHINLFTMHVDTGIAQVVDNVTKDPNAEVGHKLDKLMACSDLYTKLTKASDRSDNMKTLHLCSPEKIKRKTQETRAIIEWLQSGITCEYLLLIVFDIENEVLKYEALLK